MASAHRIPALDEATFQQMLEAAYVLQERSQTAPPARPALDPAETLAEIAATQELLRAKGKDLHASARLIAERLQKITSATGIAVALVREDRLEYCAAVGTAASLAGMGIAIDSGLSEFLQTAAADPAFVSELPKRHDGKSPFLFPVYHEQQVSGVLDVRFPDGNAVRGQDVQSCQVMAGLLGEAIARAAKVEWKQALASERATMLEVLERLRPQLERLAAEPEETAPEAEASATTAEPVPEGTSPEIEALLSAISQANEKDAAGSTCAQCGYQFEEKELFCGRCGTPRSLDAQSGAPDAAQEESSAPRIQLVEDGLHFPAQFPLAEPGEDEAKLSSDEHLSTATEHPSALALSASANAAEVTDHAVDEPPVVIVQPQGETVTPANWASASQALRWLKSLEQSNSPGRIWLAKHGGDISITLSAIILLVALTGWGLHPNQPRPGQPQNSASRLTLFERMLVGLGVAEAPTPPPTAVGNPNVWVWVDVHTALYYCPGSDLYGKTEGGKFALQHEAQLDQFQPAARKNCE